MTDDLAKLIAPYDVAPVLAALRGEPSVFDEDGAFIESRHGRPRQVPEVPPAFDGKALVAAAQAIAWLAANRAVGDDLRSGAPRLYDKVRARLVNPRLLLMGGFAPSGGAYVYFCPARFGGDEGPKLERLAVPLWKTEPFPFASVYGVYRAFVAPAFERLVERVKSTPLAPGQWEADPRASAPDAVRATIERFGIGEDAATLYLQLLTLVDCADRDITEINGWKAAQIKKAGTELAARGLVVAERKVRAGRGFALPGDWEKLWPPNPGIERAKLELHQTTFVGELVSAPLGRILPLAPLHELFAAALERAIARAAIEEPAAKPRQAPATSRGAATEAELLAAIVAAPDDDAPRAVYADVLLERGDRRGERIAVGLELDRRGREVGEASAEARARWERLLADPAVSETGFLQQHAAKWGWDRGFVDAVHMKIPAFVKNAERLMKEHPLLRRLVIEMGLRRITDAQIDALGACPFLARLVELDFSDHFIHARAFVRFAASPHLARLEVLRIGANTRGGGIGKMGSRAIASSASLTNLRVLDLPAQRIGDDGASLLAKGAEKTLTHLEELRVPANDLTDGGALALLDAPALARLRLLDLGHRDASSTSTYGYVNENEFSAEVWARIGADPRCVAAAQRRQPPPPPGGGG